VNGSPQAIEEYAANAKIVELAIVPVQGSAEEQFAQRMAQASAFRRKFWSAQLAKFSELLGTDSLKELENRDDEQAQAILLDLLNRHDPPRTPDLQVDRVINIAVLSEHERHQRYRLTLVIDPMFVPKDRNDYYAPIAQVNAVWGAVDTVTFAGQAAGDADLYLSRGGAWAGSSASSGTHDEVASSGGGGDWRLRVFGYTDAYYNYSGDWYLILDNA
jgi:hypothetical protein